MPGRAEKNNRIPGLLFHSLAAFEESIALAGITQFMLRVRHKSRRTGLLRERIERNSHMRVERKTPSEHKHRRPFESVQREFHALNRWNLISISAGHS